MKTDRKNIRKQRVNEDMTQSEVRSIASSKIDDYVNSKEFEKRVKEITADAFEKYFRMMYTKRGFWKNELK